jgi:hypothetical protein
LQYSAVLRSTLILLKNFPKSKRATKALLTNVTA